MDYRCNYFGPDGRIISTQTIRARNDAQALATAREIYARSKELRHGFELWADSYFVHLEVAGNDPAEGAKRSFAVRRRKSHRRRAKAQPRE